MIDEATKMCRWHDGGTISCSLIRECDPYTGNVHFEYALPFGSENVNIWQVAGPTATWIGPSPAPETQQLTLPEYVKDAWTFGNQQTIDPSKTHVPIIYAPQQPTPQSQPSQPSTQSRSSLTSSQGGSQRTEPVSPFSPTLYPAHRPTTPPPPAPAQKTSATTRVRDVIREQAGGLQLPKPLQDAFTDGQQLIEDSGMPWWIWAAAAGGFAYLATQGKKS